MTGNKIPGYVLVDPASGLICAFRRTGAKIYSLADKYDRPMNVNFDKFTLEEIVQFEKSEASRGPIALQLARGAWPAQQTLQHVRSSLEPPQATA